ncbi:MAG: hypothetical protein ABR950_10970 [Candidatus Dormibacteria bacterium]|jgi:hypothetical protein
MGARVDQAWNPVTAARMPAAGGDPSAAGAYPPAPAWVPAGYAGRPAAEEPSGTDWVLWVRVAIAVPSVLVGALLMLAGIFYPHVTYQQETSAGLVTHTIDLGPDIAVVVLVLLALTALIVWLARFLAVRLILLALTLVGVIATLGQLGSAVSGIRVAYLVELGWDILYGGLLALSLIAPRPRSS